MSYEDDDPCPVPKARDAYPPWPYSTKRTYALITKPPLGVPPLPTIHVGKRRFVTRRGLKSWLAACASGAAR